MRRLAVLSLHTSPLAQPGTGDGGGMNVYVRELTAALARTGVACDVFTRAWSAELPEVVDVEPGLRVHHVPAGPLRCVPKESLPSVVDEFTARVLERMAAATESGDDPGGGLPYTSVHANYWLSGLSGHVIKHELNLPLVCTFHTLDRVKAVSMPEEVEADMPHRRAEAEASIIECSDAVLASCTVEARADRLALRRRAGEDPHRAAGRRPRLLRPGPPAPGAPGAGSAARRAAVALRGADPAAQVRGRGHRGPGRAARGGRRAVPPRRGGRSERAPRREVAPGPARRGRRPGACASTSTSSSRSRTSCCRRTTGPPTCASSRAAPSRSGWWPWRRPPAGRRSSPRRWAG